ncbi:MAG: recombinase family protein [Lachnospiraceae bacterium]|jgi:site-specific DNA recombinase|nr:recombinase family protein [Lachnospiraceae bacterium]
MQENSQILYQADLYLRLSREDGDKAESDSIANQRDLLMDFLGAHPEIRLHKVQADDGYSGVNFQRPAFMNMMDSVRNKEINCIIVKDFSRLGRNFIETGKYIEKVFPFMGVRFISVNDHFDSAYPRTSSDNLLVPVKNLMNDAYCRDISIKIRSQLHVKRKKGQCIAPFAVYGYQKDPADKHRLIVDETAAQTVEDIFKKKLEGYSAQAIADWLNASGVLSPMEYKRFTGSHFSSPFKRNPQSKWTAVTVLRILKDPVYTGTLVQGKRSTPNYKIRQPMDVPRDQWIAVENCHEAIIERGTFENVGKILLTDTRIAPSRKTVYPFSGLVCCGDCGRNMVRKNNSVRERPYYYYICSGYKQKSGCTSHSIRDRLLDEAVLAAVQAHMAALLDLEAMFQAIKDLPHTLREVRKADSRLKEKQAELEKYRRYKAKSHEDYMDGIISQEDFASFNRRYDEKIHDVEEAVLRQEQELEKLAKGDGDGQKWIAYFKKYGTIQELDRKLAVELIDRIYVYEGQKIRIEFKFQNEYDRLYRLVKSAQQISGQEVG